MMTKKDFALLHEKDRLPLFYHPDWLDIVSEGAWDIAFREEKNGAYAFFIYQQRKKLTLTYSLNFQYTPFTGYYIHPENVLSPIDQKRTISKLSEALITDYENFYLHPSMSEAFAFILSGYTTISKYSYVKVLDAELENSLDNRLRNQLKKNKEEIKTAISADIDTLCLYHDSAYQGKNPYNTEILKSLYEKFGERNIFILEAENAEGKKGAILVAHDDQMAYYLAGGSESNSQLAMSKLLLDAMIYSRSLGIARFNFCGSSIPSIEKFFRKFNPDISYYFALKKNHGKKGDFIDWFAK